MTENLTQPEAPAAPRHFTELTHKEKMALKKARRDRWSELAPLVRAQRGIAIRGNYSDRPKGKPRTRSPGEAA